MPVMTSSLAPAIFGPRPFEMQLVFHTLMKGEDYVVKMLLPIPCNYNKCLCVSYTGQSVMMGWEACVCTAGLESTQIGLQAYLF